MVFSETAKTVVNLEEYDEQVIFHKIFTTLKRIEISNFEILKKAWMQTKAYCDTFSELGKCENI